MKEETITIPKSVYESERKMRFFGVEPEEVYKKKFNIFIGISISNKKITPEMAFNYLKWAVRNTKNKVAVIIADDLNIVNYEVLDGYGKGKSQNRAKKVGDEFKNMFLEIMKRFSESDKKKIEIFKWKRVEDNPYYLELKSFLEEQYKEDADFKSAVLYFIRKYMRKKGKIITDNDKINELSKYILGELPTLLEGITIDGTYYGLCIYPTYFASGMSQFVMDIHAEELEIGKKLKQIIKNRAVLVEAWLD